MRDVNVHPIDRAEVDPDEQMIVDRVYSAVMEQRLAPRTKLSESALCEAFGVGRMRVRRALLLLGSQGIVELRSNRGAYVACPSAEEAVQVFEARLMLEPGIVRRLSEFLSPAAAATLSNHMALESEARAADDRKTLIRLSGEFHVKLAEALGNNVLTRILRELVTRTSLIVGLFGGNRGTACPEDEHGQIFVALQAGDAARAERAIRDHLEHIQHGLDLERSSGNGKDLAAILRGA